MGQTLSEPVVDKVIASRAGLPPPALRAFVRHLPAKGHLHPSERPAQIPFCQI